MQRVNLAGHDLAVNQQTMLSERGYLVDLEPGIMDVIKASPMGALFKPDSHSESLFYAAIVAVPFIVTTTTAKWPFRRFSPKCPWPRTRRGRRWKRPRRARAPSSLLCATSGSARALKVRCVLFDAHSHFSDSNSAHRPPRCSPTAINHDNDEHLVENGALLDAITTDAIDAIDSIEGRVKYGQRAVMIGSALFEAALKQQSESFL